MDNLLAARWQMAISLGFHIIFAAVGIAMPLLMVIAEGLWLKTKQEEYRILAQKWSKGTAIMFAVGAVSGTVLSFELGLLWPQFMAFAGPIFGLPFALEGFAFLLEAIFIGIYLYAWDKVPPVVHWISGILVFISGFCSGIFVISANGWMNTPTGFDYINGQAFNIDPVKAMFNPAAASEAIHMSVAALQSIGLMVAAVHAYLLLRNPTDSFHRKALGIALIVGLSASLIQPIVGHAIAQQVAENQPIKLAALEGQWETEKGAPLRLGGLPDPTTETTPYALELPKALSILAYMDPEAVVKGLKEVPRNMRPPVPIVHISFQVMVLCGMSMFLLALIGIWLFWKHKKLPDQRWFLKLIIFNGPLGIIAIETGWIVTEVGRQPWIINGIMRTSEAVTPMPGLIIPLVTFTALYLVLAFTVVYLLYKQVFGSRSYVS